MTHCALQNLLAEHRHGWWYRMSALPTQGRQNILSHVRSQLPAPGQPFSEIKASACLSSAFPFHKCWALCKLEGAAQCMLIRLLSWLEKEARRMVTHLTHEPTGGQHVLPALMCGDGDGKILCAQRLSCSCAGIAHTPQKSLRGFSQFCTRDKLSW